MPVLRRAPRTVAVLVAALLALTAAFATTAAHASLVLFGRIILITNGNDSGGLTGSYFEMRDARGALVTNSSTNRTYTLLSAGTTGLALLAYTEAASPAFDRSGNSLTETIIAPTLFDGIRFSVATPRIDPVTRATNDLPSILVDLATTPATILVDLGAWTVYWNNQTFNQGSRAPTVSLTLGRTTRIVLDWSAPITEGAFRGFTGNWHIEGTVL